jgi:hypothetical protein
LDTEIAGNQNYNDHHANDGKDVHATAPTQARHARTLYIRRYLFGHRWLDAMGAKHTQVIVIATAYIPSSLRRLERAREQ